MKQKVMRWKFCVLQKINLTMPELPEVETIRQDLRKKILNKKIVQLKILKDKTVDYESTNFIQAIKGNEIKEIDRRGKLMIFRLKKNYQAKNQKEPFKKLLRNMLSILKNKC